MKSTPIAHLKEKSVIDNIKELNIKELVFGYLKYWYWFVICLVLCLTVGFLKLRYSIPLYDVASTIVISQEDNLNNAGLSTFKDLGLNQSQERIENEIQVLKSKTLIKKVIQKLNLNVLYYYEGTILDIEEYLNPLVKLSLADPNASNFKSSGILMVKVNSNTEFSFIDEDHNVISSHLFNTPVDTYLGKVKLNLNAVDEAQVKDKIIKIKVLPISSLVDSYRARLYIMTVGNNSSVLQISLRDAVIPKAIDFVDQLIHEYGVRAIANKIETSTKTAEFIDDRLIEISKGLENIDSEAANYMAKYGISKDLSDDVTSLSDMSLENAKEIDFLETQKLIIASTLDFLKDKTSNNAVIPSNLNIDDSSITTDIGNYNRLVLKRQRLLKTSSANNPAIIKIDDTLEGLRRVLFESLSSLKSRINIRLNSFKKKDSEIKVKQSQAPKISKELREIIREQGVTEKLYLYLLQKKEEADITSHITVSNSRILDKASPVSLIPVAPNKKGTYLLCALLGLLLPFVIIYIKKLLDTKVTSKKDIESILSVPFIGSIPKNKSKGNFVITKTSTSPISEAFRILRSNLDFLIGDTNKKGGKIIFVTSSISGEGKTFISSNIAKSLALVGKKVAYIGADFRLPKFHEIMDLPDGKATLGFTNYIIDSKLNVEDVSYKLNDDEALFVIPPGSIPPNPSSLLIDDRIKSMFSYLEAHYDYVVVDTAPISLVTDTILISKYADLTVFVVKENYTDKRLLSIPNNYHSDGRLVNLAVLLNYSSSNMSGAYGYGYGYNVQ